MDEKALLGAATTFSKLDEEVEILRALNLPQSRLVHSEICIHFQNAKLSSSHIPHPTVDTALPAYDRDREEMEILKRYIRRETMNLYQYIIYHYYYQEGEPRGRVPL